MSRHQNDLESLLKHRLLGSTPIPDSVRLGQCPGIFIANEFPNDVDAAGPETTVGESDAKGFTSTMVSVYVLAMCVSPGHSYSEPQAFPVPIGDLSERSLRGLALSAM